jgi:hypothetical protein
MLTEPRDLGAAWRNRIRPGLCLGHIFKLYHFPFYVDGQRGAIRAQPEFHCSDE